MGSGWATGVAMLPVRYELTRSPEKFRVRLERRLIIKWRERTPRAKLQVARALRRISVVGVGGGMVAVALF